MEGTAEPRRRRRWWLAPVVVALLVALYALGGFFGVPWLARSIATDQVAKLGRQLSLGDIRFNPFTFEARIADLRLTEADGAPLAAFESFYVDARAWPSIVQRGVVLATVQLVAPDVAVIVDADGTLNFAKLAPRSDAPPSEPGPPPRIVIEDLRLERGRVGLEDRSRPSPFAIAFTPVDLRLHDFHTGAAHAAGLQFAAAATTGERIAWTGDFTLQPFASKGHLELKGLKTSTVTAYLQDQLPVRLVSGVADAAADYHLVLQPSLTLDLQVPEVTVRDLALAEPKADRPPIVVGQLAVRDTQVSLARRDVHIGSVSIDRPSAVVVREADGGLNLSRLVAVRTATPAPAPPPAPPPVAQQPEWKVSVGHIDLTHGAVEMSDRSVKPAVALKLADLKASAADFSLDPASPLKVDLAVAIGSRGRLAAQGTILRAPLSAECKLDLRDFDVSVVQPYLQPHTGVILKSARAGVTGTLALALPADAPPAIDFDGGAWLRDLDVVERAGKRELLSWSALEVTGIAYRHAKSTLAIDRVEWSRPKARVEIAEDRRINIAEALAAPGTPAATTEPPAPKPDAPRKNDDAGKAMTVQVKTLHVDRGDLAFTDRSIQPNFAAAIQELTGDVTGLSTDPAARTRIQLAGKVDAFSPVLISGEIAPVAFDRHTDLTMSFRNMDLVRFNPYSGKFAGYNIVKGKLTTDLHYTIQDRTLTAGHHVVLDQLEFGDATGSKEAVPLPVKLAVALLKDRNGVIDLQVPISGSLDDPSFSVAPVIGKVVVNLLTKAVTAPFSLLAGLFGGGDEIQWVDFAPGRAELSEGERAKLAKLAQAMVERPQIKLDIPLTASAQHDGDVLARDALAQRVPATTTDADRVKALSHTYQELLGTDPDLPKDLDTAARIAALEAGLLPRLAPDEAALRDLSDRRSQAVQGALLAHSDIAPERVFLTGTASSEVSDAGAVRMKLAVKP